LLCGFTTSGLPLSLQLSGRPFDDARVLRVGHAYEQATGFWKRRPSLQPGAAPAPLDPKPWVPDTRGVSADVRAHAENAARRAGLALPDDILEELVAVAPHAMAMAKRLASGLPRELETCSIFDPGRDIDV
jgi:aspartyl-tRNA(Asn)/glutamyl-tRNA(Gln) amidotransferase subunit A